MINTGIHYSNSWFLEVRNLRKFFPVKKGLFLRKVAYIKAVDGISFHLDRGQTLGLVGESGCGKTTTARIILQLESPDEGAVFLEGKNVVGVRGNSMKEFRRNVQMIFQDPYSSLNPRKKAGEIIGEPLHVHRLGRTRDRSKRVIEAMQLVNLQPEVINRFPHEFSGGQRQRIGIARALTLSPKLMVCDEPISALDVSIRSQIINLLLDLQQKLGLTYIFIAHDLSVIQHVSDVVAVMYLGKIVELGPANKFFKNNLHPYSEALISAIPEIDISEGKARIILKGDVPSPQNPPSGCRFHTRCWLSKEKCKFEEPSLKESSYGHYVACHFRG